MTPAVQAPSAQDRREHALGSAGFETSIALADSEAVLCEALSAYLKDQEGLRVVGSCGSIGVVMDLVEATRPDVLLLDHGLLCDAGLDFIRTVTSVARAPSVVLLMTREDRETTALAMRMGVSACVLKQAPLTDLLAAVRSVADGHMWMSPALLTAMFAEYRADSDQLIAREQLNRLTPRELEVLRLMVAGLGRSAIAEGLHLSTNTVRTHAQNLEKKLKVHSAVAAVSIALKAGLRPD